MISEIHVSDLIMFRNKKEKSIYLEIIHTMTNVGRIDICETDSHNFNKNNLKILETDFNWSGHCFVGYNKNIEIVGIWRFNNQTKNYDVVYY